MSNYDHVLCAAAQRASRAILRIPTVAITITVAFPATVTICPQSIGSKVATFFGHIHMARKSKSDRVSGVSPQIHHRQDWHYCYAGI